MPDHALLLLLALAASSPGTPRASSDTGELVTWSSHVRGILQRNCETCHRPGQVGPFSLQSYEKARGWSAMIAEVVEEERMPPWNAREEYDGVFVNERRLTARDRELLLGWIEAGMPRGNPEEDPAEVDWPTGWRIGTPDAVFEVAEHRGERLFGDAAPLPERGYAVPREGVVEYQYFAVGTDFREDRWIQALEVHPGAADVVHHVLVFVDDPNASLEERRRQLDFRSYLAGAAPGDRPTFFPEGYAKRLPAGSTLLFQVHYTPNGKERHDRSSLGVIFAAEPPLFEVVTTGIVDLGLRIPPGADQHEVRAQVTLQEDTGLVSFSPHMHTRGKDFRYVAHYPDGTSEELCAVDYDFNWQEIYLLADPLFLPAGTRLECVGHFDNSAANPNNPDPSAWVEWGDQSFEEMFIGYYDYVRPLQ